MAQLRSNSGGHQHVKRVFAYDPDRETVLVAWSDQWNGNRVTLGETFLSELELIDKNGTFGDVRAEVQKRAGYVVPSQNSPQPAA